MLQETSKDIKVKEKIFNASIKQSYGFLEKISSFIPFAKETGQGNTFASFSEYNYQTNSITTYSAGIKIDNNNAIRAVYKGVDGKQTVQMNNDINLNITNKQQQEKISIDPFQKTAMHIYRFLNFGFQLVDSNDIAELSWIDNSLITAIAKMHKLMKLNPTLLYALAYEMAETVLKKGTDDQVTCTIDQKGREKDILKESDSYLTSFITMEEHMTKDTSNDTKKREEELKNRVDEKLNNISKAIKNQDVTYLFKTVPWPSLMLRYMIGKSISTCNIYECYDRLKNECWRIEWLGQNEIKKLVQAQKYIREIQDGDAYKLFEDEANKNHYDSIQYEYVLEINRRIENSKYLTSAEELYKKIQKGEYTSQQPISINNIELPRHITGEFLEHIINVQNTLDVQKSYAQVFKRMLPQNFSAQEFMRVFYYEGEHLKFDSNRHRELFPL